MRLRGRHPPARLCPALGRFRPHLARAEAICDGGSSGSSSQIPAGCSWELGQGQKDPERRILPGREGKAKPVTAERKAADRQEHTGTASWRLELSARCELTQN